MQFQASFPIRLFAGQQLVAFLHDFVRIFTSNDCVAVCQLVAIGIPVFHKVGQKSLKIRLLRFRLLFGMATDQNHNRAQ